MRTLFESAPPAQLPDPIMTLVQDVKTSTDPGEAIVDQLEILCHIITLDDETLAVIGRTLDARDYARDARLLLPFFRLPVVINAIVAARRAEGDSL